MNKTERVLLENQQMIMAALSVIVESVSAGQLTDMVKNGLDRQINMTNDLFVEEDRNLFQQEDKNG